MVRVGECLAGHQSRARLRKGLCNAFGDGLMHGAAIAKAHLYFGGVYVHVHPARIHFQVDDIHRLSVTV
jgi:hypothetical protein